MESKRNKLNELYIVHNQGNLNLIDKVVNQQTIFSRLV
jgi:hypothetical protein